MRVVTYRLLYPQRPFTMNEVQRQHPMVTRKMSREWREAFAWLAAVDKVPPLGIVNVTIEHHRKDGRSLPDHGACMPAAKAGLDGVVDAGVLVDDGPAYINSLTFMAPQITGQDALVIVLEPVREVS